MSTNINALDNFLNEKNDKVITQIDQNTQQVCDINTGQCETVIINQRDGLIERVDIDKTYVTKDGKMLLKD